MMECQIGETHVETITFPSVHDTIVRVCVATVGRRGFQILRLRRAKLDVLLRSALNIVLLRVSALN